MPAQETPVVAPVIKVPVRRHIPKEQTQGEIKKKKEKKKRKEKRKKGAMEHQAKNNEMSLGSKIAPSKKNKGLCRFD